MADLTTLANARNWVNVTGTTDDALLTRLVSAASVYIKSWLSRDLSSKSYSEARDGTGGDTIMFSDYPVTAVASVSVNGVAAPLSVDGIAAGYVFDDISLVLIGSRFPVGRRNVKFTYTAGYVSIPADVEQCCLELVGVKYRERGRIGEVSKSVGGETISYTQKDMPDSVKTILAQYNKTFSP